MGNDLQHKSSEEDTLLCRLDLTVRCSPVERMKLRQARLQQMSCNWLTVWHGAKRQRTAASLESPMQMKRDRHDREHVSLTAVGVHRSS